MTELSYKCRNNDIGQEMTIVVQTKYKDMEVVKLPENCYECPVGFSGGDCGRNRPWTDEDAKHRPDTCKLKPTNLLQLILDSNLI